MQLPNGDRMQNDKKGTLLMLDSSLRDLPSLAPPRPNAGASPNAVPSTLPEAPKGDKSGGKKANKKGKQTEHRAEVKEELSRVSDALRQLRGRVSDLHALHLEREGQGVSLRARLDSLGAEQARARDWAGALDGRVDGLRAKVDALRAEAAVITDSLADLAVQPDRDTALFALEDRIQEAEETLTGLRVLAAQDKTPDALADRLEGLGQGLAAQAERLDGLEGRVALDIADTPTLARLEQGIGTLGANVDDRVGALERDVTTLRDQNKRWREAERSWAEERLHGLRRGLTGGIALLALLLLSGFVATWWHGERQLDLIAARIAAVEQGAGERLAALVASPGQADERLGAVLGQLGATMQGIQATNAELTSRLTALVDTASNLGRGEPGMADLVARLRVLEDVRPAAMTGGEGSGGVGGRPQTEARPVPQAETGPETQPETGSVVGAGSQELVAEPPVEPLVEAALPAAGGLDAEGPDEVLDTFQRPQVDAGTASPTDPQPAVIQTPVDVPPVDPGPVPVAVPAEPPAAPAAPTAERYALQLIGFRAQASIAPFARKHGILAEARWLRAPGRGRAWYLVLFGDYATREEAQAAVTDLPEGLRGLSPVVRPLAAGVQTLAVE
jgi:hypothetical protein